MVSINNANTLSKFGVYLEGENRREKFYHLNTRYRVRFIGLGVTNDGVDLTMTMSKFDTPKGEFESKTVELVNGQLKYPGAWTWQDINFTVFNTYDNSNYKALYNQIQRQRNIYEQTTGDAPNNYKFTTVFEHTDGHQDTLSYWLMEGCFLKSAQTSGGENGNHDAMMIDCSMSFDNATLYDQDGNQIPTTDAGIISDITSAFTY
jgi:hypothetical protein